MARERERRRTAVRRGEIRTARRERQEGKKRRRRILYLIGAGTFATAIIVGLFLPSLLPGGGLGTGSGTSSYADGIGVPQALMPSAFHVDPEAVAYSTVPPTSGDHWSTTTQCGFYEGEIADEIVVHNMEHGNVIISYNLTEGVEQLREIHEKLERKRRVVGDQALPQYTGGNRCPHCLGCPRRVRGSRPGTHRALLRSIQGQSVQ